MKKPETWQEKRDWLKETFGLAGEINVRWTGPNQFNGSAYKLNISDGTLRSTIFETAATGEDVIRKIFDRVVNHSSGEHIIYGPEDTRITVDSAMQLQSWQPPARTVA